MRVWRLDGISLDRGYAGGIGDDYDASAVYDDVVFSVQAGCRSAVRRRMGALNGAF